MLGNMFSQFGIKNPRLGFNESIDFINHENIAHFLHTQNQGTVNCIAAARKSRSRPARNDWDPVFVRGFHHRRDLFRCSWENYANGLTGWGSS